MKRLVRSIFHLLARRVLAKYRPIVIGVGGSVGKTAAKEAIAAAITAPRRRVRRTMGSFNAEIGVPTTIISGGLSRTSWWGWLRVLLDGCLALIQRREYPQALVLELGTDKPGDLAPLIATARPRLAVVTAMTAEHLEFFSDLDTVEEEEALLLTSMPADGIAIVNVDDERIAARLTKLPGRIITYGWAERATVRAVDVRYLKDAHGLPSGMMLKVSVHDTVGAVPIPGVVGRHQAYPILAAIAAAIALGDDWEECLPRLAAYRPPAHRMAAVPAVHGAVLIDDSYNASPAAMTAALETLAELPVPGKRYAIIGQMSELGTAAVGLHRDLGKEFRRERLDGVIVIGPFVEQIRAGASMAGYPLERITEAETAEAAAATLLNRLGAGDAVLIKGSRFAKSGYSGHLDRAVTILRAPAE